MPDQHFRRLILLAQCSGSANQVFDVGREVGIGKIPVAVSKTGRIEAPKDSIVAAVVCGKGTAALGS